jgi:hypothetical protein
VVSFGPKWSNCWPSPEPQIQYRVSQIARSLLHVSRVLLVPATCSQWHGPSCDRKVHMLPSGNTLSQITSWRTRWDTTDAAVESVHSGEFSLHYDVNSFCASEIVTSRSFCECCSRVANVMLRIPVLPR